MLHTFYTMFSNHAFSDLGHEFGTMFYPLLPSYYPRTPDSPMKVTAKFINAVLRVSAQQLLQVPNSGLCLLI